ncbi:hypothetical protein K1719_005467 [Acacia pycnantha]|nr:hypothetical protein K1719_005467 [Acacia pycnantha]
MTTSMVMASSHKIFLLCFFITFLPFPTTQAQTYIYHNCSSNKPLAANSAFQSDLTSLLSSLASNKANDFYSDTVVGRGDTVYGLFMCRGDVNLTTCHQCVVNATQRLPSECPVSKEAIVWYDECLLRYSNRSFFSTVATRPRVALLNTGNVSNPASFMRILYDTMNKTADEAAKPAVWKKKYANATTETLSSFQTMYCRVQCTPDLSPSDCRRCLSGAIGDLNWCCVGKIGGRVLYPSCYVRYELYPFYSSEDPAPPTTPAIVPLAGSQDDEPKATTPTPTALSPTNSSDPQVKGTGQSTRTVVIVVVSSVGGLLLFVYLAYYLSKSLIKTRRNAVLRQKYFGNETNNLEPLRFSLATIEAATNKFSHENCLGQGGFGRVYKGVLSNGQEMAIKRLSKSSDQGAEEFKNEVLLIAKLQHRNLVALLGFCIEEREKVLIYEYIPNKSLDNFLFGSQKVKVLNWLERCKIIGGVARGILYLHEYSRFKVIHRDLKPSNILLDNEMNPRISDFGLAKLVTINTNEGSTNRIVGTYGYMSPEYAMYGQYSEKSDVFSFGVIVLEIISGKKNTSRLGPSQYAEGLLSYAWKQWKEEKLLEILDSNIEEFGSYNEVIKCIQIGLLCVQEDPDSRPTMAEVVSYLSNDSSQLPLPQEPAFSLHAGMKPSTSSGSNNESGSTIEVSISEFFPHEAAKPAVGKKKYANTTTKDFSAFQSVYCLAQCTPDLSPSDCSWCLSEAIGDLNWCCYGKTGGRVLYPSCYVRYELYRFYSSEDPAPTTTPAIVPLAGSRDDEPEATTPTPVALSPTNSLDPQVKGTGQSTRTVVIVVVSSVVGLLLFVCLVYYLLKSLIKTRRNVVLGQKYFGNETNNLEPLRFSLATIEATTNKFSHLNCLGQGGFGRVYKGVLSNGQEMAIKRLSKSSDQGSQKGKVLNWVERCKIIGGVARGILYLHEYSRLKVIHCDLKPSNILLDNEMNPKISNFGLAKLVTVNTNEGSINRIVGTYGYMSPEYAMYGQYSEKSDVFSFGVMVLEIISGKKNTSRLGQSQYAEGLLSYAWKQWKEEKLVEILDSNMEGFGSYNEVIKCIQIGLFCVQENPDSRTTMAEVVSYFSNDSSQLPLPQEPAFSLHTRMVPSTSRGSNNGHAPLLKCL